MAQAGVHAITSEIFEENDNSCLKLKNGSALSKFVFKCPSYLLLPDNQANIKYDSDDDLDVNREEERTLLIEHKMSTHLQHVGLQVWRGALLLADYILSHPEFFIDEVVLELGAGVGLTSIVASLVAKEVICTDIDMEGMLRLIQRNFLRNITCIRSKYCVKEVDFLNLEWNSRLKAKINSATVILAADVIYDEKITMGFVRTLAQLLDTKKAKVVYVALEKRYVFTIADLDTVAPMYEDFLQCIAREKLDWSIEYVKIDFPRYFNYDRVKHMILMKIQNKPKKFSTVPIQWNSVYGTLLYISEKYNLLIKRGMIATEQKTVLNANQAVLFIVKKFVTCKVTRFYIYNMDKMIDSKCN